MLDQKLIRQDPEAIAQQLARRGYSLDVAAFNALELQRKSLQVETEELQSRRNKRSKEIGQIKAQGGDIEPIKAEMSQLGEELKVNAAKLDEVQTAMQALLLDIPNLPQADVPDGEDGNDNVELRKWGTPKAFDFDVRDHVDIGEKLGQID
ncbi:MAG: serine--tRNA ligase, partial [Salinisphaeraceae bacterium]|nr:serine--tRNA ligase [Salinisphaeraceae bacterium]